MKDDEIWFWVAMALLAVVALSGSPSECVPTRYDSC